MKSMRETQRSGLLSRGPALRCTELEAPAQCEWHAASEFGLVPVRGELLSPISPLSFRTYNPSAGNGGSATRSAYLNFNVDFNGSDTWQRRLVFVPSQNGVVMQDTAGVDAINGGNALWKMSGGNWPGAPVVSGTTLKTWNQILAEYPGVRIRVTDAHLGLRSGSRTTAATPRTSILHVRHGSRHHDLRFRAMERGDIDGRVLERRLVCGETADLSTFKNQGDCVSYVQNGK